ncbi:hypothetical protein SAMD00019534_093370, partial [Acytostelium subglobosum LB1]|uniref:hypothetical protein n=1 Tax=Acytostelium subglobosum LB1 TaxID=1410327 RepID=UPI00064510B4
MNHILRSSTSLLIRQCNRSSKSGAFNNILSSSSSIKSSISINNIQYMNGTQQHAYSTTTTSTQTTTMTSTPSTQTTTTTTASVNVNETIVDQSFAVVHLGGKQYKVIKGDIIMADRLPNIDVGEHIVLDKVLMVGTKETTMIGTPLVEGAKVHAFIEEQSKASHVTIFKHKRRKNYKRTTGFTPLATVIRIGDVVMQQQ